MTVKQAERLSDRALRGAIRTCRILHAFGELPQSMATGFTAQVCDYLTDEWTLKATGRHWCILYERIEQLLKAEAQKKLSCG